MRRKYINLRILGPVAIAAAMSVTSNAQSKSNSATHATAELTKGRLNPAQSKPGDTVALRLKDDVKSNGRLVLKKGTTITGVVRNVKHETKGQAQSMMEIEWFAPVTQGKAAQDVSIALQSIIQSGPADQQEQNTDVSDDFGIPAGNPLSRISGQSNAALLSMPSVVPLDHQTSAAIENSLGSSSAGQLFRVGHGQLLMVNGSQQSVDLFSHLSNDTVITSQSKNFEISSGAQMQLLVGVNRK